MKVRGMKIVAMMVSVFIVSFSLKETAERYASRSVAMRSRAVSIIS